ncbi:MAG: uracil-DNA glycosylase family protein [Acidimicrobiales bacterium]|nr:uracil-DNA glycosylase family protein [Acidimicrobiales bacterium]
MSHDETTSVYDELAGVYDANRSDRFADRAVGLAGSAGDVVLDVGCGTGAYLTHLGGHSVGLDVSVGMLARARSHDRPLVRATLDRLPFRRAGLGAGWARNSYLHVSHGQLPLALAELHRALRPGAPLVASFISGDDDHVVSDDDLPGRHFWRWSDGHLVDVFTGAGFAEVRLSGETPRFVEAIRARTLPDTVGAGMRLLVCGLNPSLHAADAGVGFFTPGNRFWPAALDVGLASVDRDAFHALRHHGLGMTDLVKRATTRADELSRAEYREGLARVDRLCARLRPRAVCMVGLAGWRAAVDRKATTGWQDHELGGGPVYVMPSTSGLNAHSRPADLAAHLRAAASFSTK